MQMQIIMGFPLGHVKRNLFCLVKPGFHMIVPIAPVVSKNVQTIGTIMWKRYPDDPDRFKVYTIVPIVRIELNSIQAD